MNKVITLFWIVSWSFFFAWVLYGGIVYGLDWIPPIWYKLPLLLSLGCPLMLFLTVEIIKSNKRSKSENGKKQL